ncbi:hypothetical protein GCM10018962_70240 [Dactylosporangium matsuzakiense]|uniref:Uncharacterized protein n=1 Tax=Dactylosporangium matsuzakiense TaxID=53360 RepID=A0A9W6KL58_9ACTN|nr:hypothetical protein GCM10017581_032350 [Dactylosporangium matsuzakiense]
MDDTPTRAFAPARGLPPEGPDRRRRRVRYVLIAVAVLVLVVPIGVWLLMHRGGAGSAGPAPVVSSPSAAASASAGPSPAQGSRTPTPAAPDGRIAAATLKNATLEIPAWPADNLTGPSGRVTFTDGQFLPPPSATQPDRQRLAMYDIVYGDVDRDGAGETVAAIFCGWQGGSTQIVAFDRNRAGAIVTVGRVVATTGEIRTIGFDTMRVLADGTVRVTVGDYLRCCGDETPTLSQTRGYRWDGHAFVQVSGPTSFPLNPAVTETGLTVGELVLGPASNGVRHGTLTVSVTYTRGVKPGAIELTFYRTSPLLRDGSGWPPVRDDGYGAWSIERPAPAIGATATYTFAFSSAATDVPQPFDLTARGVSADGTVLAESNPFNDNATVTVRTTA